MVRKVRLLVARPSEPRVVFRAALRHRIVVRDVDTGSQERAISRPVSTSNSHVINAATSGPLHLRQVRYHSALLHKI